MLELLHGQNAGVGRLFIRAASSIIREMLAQYPELAQKYILSLMLEPLAKTTKEIEGTSTCLCVNCYLYDWNVVTAVELVDDVKPKLKFTEGCGGVKPITLKLCGGYGCCSRTILFQAAVL